MGLTILAAGFFCLLPETVLNCDSGNVEKYCHDFGEPEFTGEWQMTPEQLRYKCTPKLDMQHFDIQWWRSQPYWV